MLASRRRLMQADSISAIVPTLNEERSLLKTLERLAPEVDELLVVDGGSLDGTATVAERNGARVLHSMPGRGVQLQRGAEEASGSILWFVHADTLVPRGAGGRIRAAICLGYEAGAFAVEFHAPGWRYRLGSLLATSRTRWGGLALGDQAIFVTRRCFFEVGGYPPWPLFEDVSLWRKLKRKTRTVLLEPPVITSARRFEKLGPLRTVFVNWALLLLYHFGVSPHRLARWYRSYR